MVVSRTVNAAIGALWSNGRSQRRISADAGAEFPGRMICLKRWLSLTANQLGWSERPRRILRQRREASRRTLTEVRRGGRPFHCPPI